MAIKVAATASRQILTPARVRQAARQSQMIRGAGAGNAASSLGVVTLKGVKSHANAK